MSTDAQREFSIVIVDDSDFTRKHICAFLSKMSFEKVRDFSNAKDALDYIALKKVDVAIVDVVMPEISGIELTRKISEKFPNTKVIMMSSLGQERVIMESIAAGAVDFLQKPLNEELLMDGLLRLWELKAKGLER